MTDTDSSVDRIQAINTLDADWSPEDEHALVRKIDARLLPTCFIIFVLAYIDRGNIGSIRVLQFGKHDSLEESLALHGNDFNWAVSATYFVMTAMLLPSILALKVTSAKVFFPLVMILWGAVVMAMAASKNAASLIATRFFLGVPESGVAPCIAFFFFFWYLPRERAFRLGLLFSANSLGVAASGLPAIAIDNLNGKGGLKSWQWAFPLEGAAPIVLAPAMYLGLLAFPETDKSLTERERHIAINRFGRGSTRKTDITWDTQALFRLISRPSTYVFFLAYVCFTIIILAMANLLPTILVQLLRFRSLKANLYAAAAALFTIPLYWLWPLHSDWTRERMWHYLLPLLACIPAFATWTWASSHPGQTTIQPVSLYGMAFLANLVIIGQPVLVAYRTSTLYGATEQAVGVAFAFAAVSIGSIIAPQMYPTTDAPLYHTAFIATCVIIATAIASYLTLPYLLYSEARHRKAEMGHAMPLRAMEDADRSQVATAVRQAPLEHEMSKEAESNHIEHQAVNNV
ncbi:hypothetical protein BBP40_005404 [Aspergillus hancockii]|nr:hypothetical protein BBP40_005404 [Aspergillus hancockii]